MASEVKKKVPSLKESGKAASGRILSSRKDKATKPKAKKSPEQKLSSSIAEENGSQRGSQRSQRGESSAATAVDATELAAAAEGEAPVTATEDIVLTMKPPAAAGPAAVEGAASAEAEADGEEPAQVEEEVAQVEPASEASESTNQPAEAAPPAWLVEPAAAAPAAAAPAAAAPAAAAPSAADVANLNEFVVGEHGYMLNPYYRDGTRLRVSGEADADFNEQFVLNDYEVEILEILNVEQALALPQAHSPSPLVDLSHQNSRT